ncbi:hypothetical protein NL108_018236 [Boleophthalmus pectinirostris]|uniref:leukocyte elastase inhibitor-like n=1 Tax=Boleophthalmus pectinirostris TaxID=150288 RepID=UPI00242D40E2|nr:leukocyte elastase inhibitor-like [Boleophthalmus pectinirostris]XP_055006725.1 leukocyte elastase inhibitor-like [Boleophthalmus pectinirostris]KAJ0060003.1 hypothetical protein NL108_018236 [Boleophthalmus pectinirostris]
MASETPISKANITFALNLFKTLGENDHCTNVFFSPLSISSALSMVLLGARGNTAAQMSECLKTKDLSDDVHSRFGTLLQEFHKPHAPYALSVANKLYGEQSFQFVKDFLGATQKYYKAELQTVDFKGKSEEARVTINKWVEQKTQDKIKDLVAKGMVNSSTSLVLVNAIYFKGNWDEPFDEDSTCDDQFWINKNESKPVKMMHQTSWFPLNFISEINCQIIVLPYEGNELSMLIFLPSSIEDGLEKLEQQLTYENFMKWTCSDMMAKVKVQVGLPRFKMEENYDLKDVLISMGMVDAFDISSSDFSGMSPANDLFLSAVVHKAFVEVNEKGTEAAAATAVTMMVGCAVGSQPARFIADHPYLFFIRHNASNTVLFAGRFCSPK